MPDALPPIGFGFWKVAREDAADVAYEAIKAGYRQLDCAADYGNEIEVGEGIEVEKIDFADEVAAQLNG